MLRFTIRDLLWLTLVVGLAVAWWVDHRRQADEMQNFKDPWQRFEPNARPGFTLDVF